MFLPQAPSFTNALPPTPRQAGSPTVTPNLTGITPTTPQPTASPFTLLVIIGFSFAGALAIGLGVVLGIRHYRRRKRDQRRAAVRANGGILPPAMPPTGRHSNILRKQHRPRGSHDMAQKEPLTGHGHTRNFSLESISSLFGAPRVSFDSLKGHIANVITPPQETNKLRKPHSPTSPTSPPPRKPVEKPAVIAAPLPPPHKQAVIAVPLPTPPFEQTFEKTFEQARTDGKPSGPTAEFDPVAYREHMHRFSLLLSPAQRISFVFDELTKRAVQAPFDPVLPDELVVQIDEEVFVIECFDDGWSIVQRAGRGEPVQGVIPTACWAGLPRDKVTRPMRYGSLRHGVDAGLFEIGTAL